jgi:hypothetical protein
LFGISALTSLVIGACVATSSRSRPPLEASPETSIGVNAESLNFIPGPGSRVELHGTTNIGPWTSQSKDIHGRIDLRVSEKALNALFDNLQGSSSHGQGGSQTPPLTLPVRGRPVVDISVPIDSLHSDKPGMDRDMREALKASEYPAISYTFEHLQQAAVQRTSQDGLPGLKLQTVGSLNLAGVGRRIEMDVHVDRDFRRHFIAHAQTTLLMSDFGVNPPVALFGLIKAGERVEVTFDLDVILSDNSAGQK